jgi:hypothetical protein
MATTYIRTRHFDRSLNAALMTGQARKQIEKVGAVLIGLETDDPFKGLPLTDHGETRIPKCLKYELGEGWRLVTVRDGRLRIFLFVGNHKDVDAFLDKHRGTRFGIADGEVIVISGSGARSEARQDGEQERILLDMLDEDDSNYVTQGVPRSIMRLIDGLTTRSSAADIDCATSGLSTPSQREFIADVLRLVSSGNEQGWKRRIAFEKGEIAAASSVDDDEIIRVQQGDEIGPIVIGSREYEEYMRRLRQDGPWYDWFLYLHPEQRRVVEADYTGPAQLSGVSGSGKTCVLVKRAVRLTELADVRVLVITLNRSLAGLINQLVDATCLDSGTRQRIEVNSYFDFARALMIEADAKAGQHFDDRSWKLQEHVDEVFREYYRCWLNSHTAEVMLPLHRQLVARGVNGEDYVREEFDWIRSAIPRNERQRYLTLDRAGRRVPLLENRREEMLRGLEGWEDKMNAVGVVDYLGLSDALRMRLQDMSPRYDHILIDEVQDFGTTELAVLRRLAKNGPNDMFLCGDAAQSVLPKHRSLGDAGITLTKREGIRRNYRNSREILRAAYDLLVHCLDTEIIDRDDLEILDPEQGNFSGPAPCALSAESFEHEVAFARSYAATCLERGAGSVCVAFAGFSARAVEEFARQCGVEALNGAYDPQRTALVFSDLEQTKGYEFDTLIIVNCSESVVPAHDAPAEETYRQALKLYVAMTRARRELILSYCKAASPWLVAVADRITLHMWSDFEELNAVYLGHVPRPLQEVSDIHEEEDLGSLTGRQFIYTGAALGLSIETLNQLEEAVDGIGAVSGGNRRVRWRDICHLATDLKHLRLGLLPFSPQVYEEPVQRLQTYGFLPERRSGAAGKLSPKG